MPPTAGTWREFIGGTINSSYLYSTTLKFSLAQPLSVLCFPEGPTTQYETEIYKWLKP